MVKDTQRMESKDGLAPGIKMMPSTDSKEKEETKSFETRAECTIKSTEPKVNSHTYIKRYTHTHTNTRTHAQVAVPFELKSGLYPRQVALGENVDDIKHMISSIYLWSES